MTDADALYADLRRLSLIGPGERPPLAALAGGVSSDITRVDRPGGAICVKRALPKLKVAAEWFAPVARNAAEADWMRVAASVDARMVPAILAEDRARGLFAMAYLDPATHPVWKALLRDGVIEAATARAVAARLARLHAATSADPAMAARFANAETFAAIRLEPYLLATAGRHPALAEPLRALAARTGALRVALVHGDVSPKNILVGPDGPVFLDAECATYGDPAFDLAFCLNHLLLKSLWRPHWAERYLHSLRAAADAYLAGVTWEAPAALEARAAGLLPALLLARVDGKSPVEYVTEERDRARVRGVACSLLRQPVARLGEVAAAWAASVV